MVLVGDGDGEQLVPATSSTASVISTVDIVEACRAVQVAITSWNKFGWSLTANNLVWIVSLTTLIMLFHF